MKSRSPGMKWVIRFALAVILSYAGGWVTPLAIHFFRHGSAEFYVEGLKITAIFAAFMELFLIPSIGLHLDLYHRGNMHFRAVKRIIRFTNLPQPAYPLRMPNWQG